MKFTLSWLRDHLDTDASVEEIARTLNAIGLEVEGIEDRGAALAGTRASGTSTSPSSSSGSTTTCSPRSAAPWPLATRPDPPARGRSSRPLRHVVGWSPRRSSESGCTES